MSRTICMLRGINVSGKNKIAMADLKAAFERDGFQSVSTYIQSGNILFEMPGEGEKKLVSRVSQLIAEAWSYEVGVVIRSAGEMQRVVENNPWLTEKGIDLSKVHVTFLDEKPAVQGLRALDVFDQQGDTFRVVGREIYVHCPNGYGRTRLNNAYFEKKLGRVATTRNWKTVNTLCGLAEKP